MYISADLVMFLVYLRWVNIEHDEVIWLCDVPKFTFTLCEQFALSFLFLPSESGLSQRRVGLCILETGHDGFMSQVLDL